MRRFISRIAALAALILLIAALGSCVGPSQNNLMRADEVGQPPVVFPTMAVANLNGTSFQFPETFQGAQTLILFGFEYDHQVNLDAWIAAAEPLKKDHPKFKLFEMVVIEEASVFYRWYVNNAKRYFIPDPASRLRNLNLYTPKTAFLKQMAMPDEKRIYCILFDQNGKERWRDDGALTKEKLSELVRLLDQSPPDAAS